MKSKTWNPFRELSTLREQMNKFLDEGSHLLNEEKNYPSIDIYEREDNLVIRADLPGIKPEDIDVLVSEESIIIEGESKQENEQNKDGYYYQERKGGYFRRRISLPVKVKHKEVQADVEHGVMEVVVPKADTELGEATKLNLGRK